MSDLRTRNLSIVTLGLALAAGPSVFAQATPAAPLQFEVVTLKPSDPKAMHLMGVQLTADRITMNNETLKGLICVAYDIPCWELSGGEPWMDKDHFDFEAKPPVGEGIAPYSQRHANFDLADERLRQMMQTMLADRFHLEVSSRDDDRDGLDSGAERQTS